MADSRKTAAILLLVFITNSFSPSIATDSYAAAQQPATSYPQPVAPTSSYAAAPQPAPASSSYGTQSMASPSYGAVQSQPVSSYGQPTGGSSYGNGKDTPKVPQVADTVVLGMNLGAPIIPVPDNYVPTFHTYNPIVPLAPKVVFNNPWIDFNPGEPADVPDTADQWFDFEVDEPYLFETGGFFGNAISQGGVRYFELDSGFNGGLGAGNNAGAVQALGFAPAGTSTGGITGPLASLGIATDGSGGTGGGSSHDAGSGGSYGGSAAPAPSSSYGQQTEAAPAASYSQPAAAPTSSSSYAAPAATGSTYARTLLPVGSFKSTPSSPVAPTTFTGAQIPGRSANRFLTSAQQQPQDLVRVQRHLFPIQQQQQQQQTTSDGIEDLNKPFEHPAKIKLASLSALQLQQQQRPQIVEEVNAVKIVAAPVLTQTAAPVPKRVVHPLFAARQRAFAQLSAQRQEQKQIVEEPIIINISSQQPQQAAAPNVSMEISTLPAAFDDNTPVVHPLFSNGANGPKVDQLMSKVQAENKFSETPATVVVLETSKTPSRQDFLHSPAVVSEAIKLHPALRNHYEKFSLLATTTAQPQVQPIAPVAEAKQTASTTPTEKSSVAAPAASTIDKISGILNAALAPIGFNVTEIESRSNFKA